MIDRLKKGDSYRPGECVLESAAGPSANTEHDTIIRLGALELLGNISSGRLSTTDKDPFPHQLALQQYVRRTEGRDGPRRLLIADEVGLGKTVEVGLILRDILLARGQANSFRCLYLTSGGLVDDAAAKLRDVLNGVVDGENLVNTVESFRSYGSSSTFGVHVASTHAARLYVERDSKHKLPKGVQPDIVIIDECHHASSGGDLAGIAVTSRTATQTYLAVKQLFSGEFWGESKPPRLGILMSATPFRSHEQFINLLRLLTDGVAERDDRTFNAYARGVDSQRLRGVLQGEESAAGIVWRRQSDPGVVSWSGGRIFPNLTVRRPHSDSEGLTPRLPEPSKAFLLLVDRIKTTITRITSIHGQRFNGLMRVHLEKMLTSSSLAGACWLFTWAVRRCEWANKKDSFSKDTSLGTEGLRRLILLISQRIATSDPKSESKHADVNFPSQNFMFKAKSLGQAKIVDDIYDYSKSLRKTDSDEELWVATNDEIVEVVRLAEALLGVVQEGEAIEGAQDLKLDWLKKMLEMHPDERFILFTESLQTCEVLKNELGKRAVVIEGCMEKHKRLESVEQLRDPKGSARILLATSAADEGIDLQIASKVIHWDMSASPATLMQRNGRAARLGQVRDVEAYYLVLKGTHEERRDTSLRSRFAQLGIDDESMKSRILGSLTEEEEQQLHQAIADNNDRAAGQILSNAKRDNELMDKHLAEIQAKIEPAQVLSRMDLAERLQRWKKIGLPQSGLGELQYDFEAIAWQKPVFEATSRFEVAISPTAKITDKETEQTFVFDPEFFVFGPKTKSKRPKLAGLPPWLNKEGRFGKQTIQPYNKSDLLGQLFHRFARLNSADFLTLSRSSLSDTEIPTNACWLLFCTHPLRDVENVLPTGTRPYLTYYTFTEVTPGITPVPLVDEGADADEVHKVIDSAELFALSGLCLDETPSEILQSCKDASRSIRTWVESVTKFGRESFLDDEKFFIPIPVALVRITDDAVELQPIEAQTAEEHTLETELTEHLPTGQDNQQNVPA